MQDLISKHEAIERLRSKLAGCSATEPWEPGIRMAISILMDIPCISDPMVKAIAFDLGGLAEPLSKILSEAQLAVNKLAAVSRAVRDEP